MRPFSDLLRRLLPALAAALVLAAAVAACSDDPEVTSTATDDVPAAEGDQDDTETDDTETDDTEADDTETDDTVSTTTSSVAPTPDPVQSVPDELAPYCNASYAMSESPGLSSDAGPEETQAFYEGLIDALDELLTVAPAELEPDLRTVQDNFSEVLRILAEADWDLDAGFAAVGEWAEDPEIADAMDAAIDRLEDYDEDVCGITY